ncbi:DUF4224 domain-containing protein [uncultured Roseobacter sp.]|uniref:DUF4224 domain-containing protein n=1 Tax=uncultured Roseobacter sp. TaxID=114847 RepID=UPI00345D6B9C
MRATTYKQRKGQKWIFQRHGLRHMRDPDGSGSSRLSGSSGTRLALSSSGLGFQWTPQLRLSPASSQRLTAPLLTPRLF